MTSGDAERGRFRWRSLLPYAFVLPPMIYLCVFMFWPLVREMAISLTRTRLTNPNGGRFVGLRNYEALLHDPGFYNVLWVTVFYAAASVVFGVTIGVIAALAINRPFRFRPAARAILLFGWAVPTVAATLIWLWMYNEQSGVFNEITEATGLGRIAWLTSQDWAMTSILITTTWQVAPFVMLVVLAALQSVPEEVREAARVDGADPLNVFRTVTLPHIRPAIQLVALLVAVWSIRRFELIYLLTGGGPLDSTATLVVKLRQEAFERYDLGTAAAYGAVGLVLALVVAGIHFGFERHRMKGAA